MRNVGGARMTPHERCFLGVFTYGAETNLLSEESRPEDVNCFVTSRSSTDSAGAS
jgi:hypothetical protein